jgi:hypothetical protein
MDVWKDTPVTEATPSAARTYPDAYDNDTSERVHNSGYHLPSVNRQTRLMSKARAKATFDASHLKHLIYGG